MAQHIHLHHLRPKNNSKNYHEQKYTPVRLVFGRDPIINRHHDVDWEVIRKQKQDLINNDNEPKNCYQINHTNKHGDNVLLKKA